MTRPELLEVLLASHLGDTSRKVLTPKQTGILMDAWNTVRKEDPAFPMTLANLRPFGVTPTIFTKAQELFSQEAQVLDYVHKAEALGLRCLTYQSPDYPQVLKDRMGADAPRVLWAVGEMELLGKPMISVVGSRNLAPENDVFAETVGEQTARAKAVLVTGGAAGADTRGWIGALNEGGKVILVLPDAFREVHARQENHLFLWEDSFDLPFSGPRALSRNHVIHALGRVVFVAQTSAGRGGTWSGSRHNLLHGYSPVFCMRDGTPGAAALEALGAKLIGTNEIPGSISEALK